ncbi:YuzD family protein [Paenisporosarcina sp. TG20]|uniref:YuzD family protein n=1 Tax=Paenisporosarcina sp. TG20 TaxID=1211706 RepID=UPI000304887E|nr:YuzD family protein [Paenisporosarcina sp. TG20]
MKKKILSIEIFGADIICASCVNAPTSKDTYEWLQAAIGRKYPNSPYEITYIDIQKPTDNERQQELANRVLDDEFFYPLVLIEGKVVGEGNINLNSVFMELEKYGFTST